MDPDETMNSEETVNPEETETNPAEPEMHPGESATTSGQPAKRRRILVRAATAAAGLVVLAIVALGVVRLVMPTFVVQDALYNNVPSKAECSRVPPRHAVDRVIEEFPEFDDSTVIAVDRCDGALIEVQYDSDATRDKVEAFLDAYGTWQERTGWWWRSIPVQLRNV